MEGLFAVGFAVLIAAVADRPRDRRLWAALGLSFLAILINPYFLRGALHPLVLYSRINGTLAVYSSTIGEFLGPFNRTVHFPATDLYPWFLGLTALALILGRRPRAGELILLAVFGFLSFRARRNLALFAVVSVPIVSRWLSLAGSSLGALAFWKSRSATNKPTPKSPLSRKALPSEDPTSAKYPPSENSPSGKNTPSGKDLSGAVPSMIFGILAGIVGLAILVSDFSFFNNRIYAAVESNRSFGASEAPGLFPWDASRYLSQNAIRGPIYTSLSQGSFLIWAYPQERVFIDGRLEVHSTGHFALNLALRNGGRAWQEADARYRFEAAVIDYVEAPRLAMERIQDPDWALVHLDGRVAVLLKRVGKNANAIGKDALDGSRLHQVLPALPAGGSLLPPRGSWLARHFAVELCPWDEMNLGQLLMDLERPTWRRSSSAGRSGALPISSLPGCSWRRVCIDWIGRRSRSRWSSRRRACRSAREIA